MDVGCGQQFTATCLDPAFTRTGLTLGAVPITAAVVRTPSLPLPDLSERLSHQFCEHPQTWLVASVFDRLGVVVHVSRLHLPALPSKMMQAIDSLNFPTADRSYIYELWERLGFWEEVDRGHVSCAG